MNPTTGVVMKSTGSQYVVRLATGDKIKCRMRGKMRLEESRETNPIAVGDRVSISIEASEGIISEVLPRQNHILRKSVKKSGHTHVLAANIDRLMIIATVAKPRTSPGFIDRLLATAEAFRIPQILLFNKKDLIARDEPEEVHNLMSIYESMHITTRLISAFQPADIESFSSLLSHKTTLIVGHSGVGKSTLLNSISPAFRQSVGAISDFSDKGVHTTTFAEMFEFDETTFIIDTPGIKEWGLIDMSDQEVSDYFPDMREVRTLCKFGARCLHLTEPGCAILEAVKTGSINISRYNSYVSIIRGEDTRR